mmetsp:Transcript_6381/g.15700  ORF Transcript_6381/g.15700 Transcript_6381/m.15700 type:complete len:243 (-) Transcript_6381:617-1345(-)
MFPGPHCHDVVRFRLGHQHAAANRRGSLGFSLPRTFSDTALAGTHELHRIRGELHPSALHRLDGGGGGHKADEERRLALVLQRWRTWGGIETTSRGHSGEDEGRLEAAAIVLLCVAGAEAHGPIFHTHVAHLRCRHRCRGGAGVQRVLRGPPPPLPRCTLGRQRRRVRPQDGSGRCRLCRDLLPRRGRLGPIAGLGHARAAAPRARLGFLRRPSGDTHRPRRGGGGEQLAGPSFSKCGDHSP